MATIDIDIDLDEFDNDDIISEVENRLNSKFRPKFNDDERMRLAKIVKGISVDGEVKPSNAAPNIGDWQKWQILEEVFNKYNIFQIEEMVKQYESVKA